MEQYQIQNLDGEILYNGNDSSAVVSLVNDLMNNCFYDNRNIEFAVKIHTNFTEEQV